MVGHRPASIFSRSIEALSTPAVVRRKGNFGCCPCSALSSVGLLVVRRLYMAINGSLKLIGMCVKLRVGGVGGAQIEGGIITTIEIRSRLVGIIPQIAIHNAQIDIKFAVAVAKAYISISR